MTLTAQSALLLLRRDPSRCRRSSTRSTSSRARPWREMALWAAGELPRRGSRAGSPGPCGCTARSAGSGMALAVTVEVDGDEALPEEDERALLRIAQEGLNNVVKHAGTGRAVVRLRLQRPLRLEVADEGRGFDPRDRRRPGLGLAGMRGAGGERGWSFSVTSRPGPGTRVIVEEPGRRDAATSEDEEPERDRAWSVSGC